jgi:hypothetical protein
VKKTHTSIIFLVFISIILSACTGVTSPPPGDDSALNQPEPAQLAMLTFRVTLPNPVSAGEKITLVVLDEVTGLAFNQQKYPLHAEDNTHFMGIYPFPLNSVIKYRYIREGAYTVQEHTPDGQAVRYRMYVVSSPGVIQDTISRWTDTSYNLPSGRISGFVLDVETHQALADIMVTVAGLQVNTLSDGSFLIEDVPEGIHNLVAYSKDGMYQPFQQQAQVSSDQETPTNLALSASKLVNILFTVLVPENTPPESQIRFAANLSFLGNTFADLSGGISTIAARMPTLSRLPDGRHSITLMLPAGTDLYYKYTLGDGIWDAELNSQGGFNLRRLIVPEENLLIEDKVEKWTHGVEAPVVIEATVPPITPEIEDISIQFNPGYGWMEPVPMWKVDTNTWRFTLFSPLQGLKDLQYRYCRLNECNSASETSTQGPLASGRQLTILSTPQIIKDTIEQWAWYSGPPDAAVVPNSPIESRGQSFWAGIELQPYYRPGWESQLGDMVSQISVLNGNWLIATPTWHLTQHTNPVLEPKSEEDIPPSTLNALVIQAKNDNLAIALYPILVLPPQEIYSTAEMDFSQWTSWLTQYRRFILHFAVIAAQTNADALILGGGWINPTINLAVNNSDELTVVKPDPESFIRMLISEIKTIYQGPLLWALPYTQLIQNPPTFVDAVDMLYIGWSAPISSPENGSLNEIYQHVVTELDSNLLPIQEKLNKPIILSISYPSALGSMTGCLVVGDQTCLDFSSLDRPKPDLPHISLNLNEQTLAYNAMMQAIAERSWISGVVSAGYFLPLPLQDKSNSVNGKPASGVLWFWFSKILGE